MREFHDGLNCVYTHAEKKSHLDTEKKKVCCLLMVI